MRQPTTVDDAVATLSLIPWQVLAHLVKEHMDASDITQDPTAPLNYTALATQTEGYSVTDLKDLVARAVHRAAIRSSEHQLSGHDESQQVRAPFIFCRLCTVSV